jgi:DNA-binding beta-propeller fold protein YncE
VARAWLILCTLLAATPGCGAGDAPASDGGSVLVSLAGDNAVVAIDLESGRETSRFPVVSGPHEIDVSSDARYAYVANVGGGPTGSPGRHVSVIDLRSGASSSHDLRAFEMPHDVRVARDGTLVWVACAPARTILELDAASGAIRREWNTTLDGGWFVAVTPDAQKLYVPHLEGKGVTAIDRRSGRTGTVLSGGAQSGIDVSPDGREVWVIDHERRRVNIISTADDRIVGGLDLESPDFGRLRFTPDGRRVVIVQGTRAAVVDAAARREIETITMPLAGKVVAVSPAGDRAVVSNPEEGRITVLAMAPLRVVKSISAGKSPDGVAWMR